VFRGCNAPIDNPRNPDDPNRRFTCFTCNETEGFGSSGKKIKRRFSAQQRLKGGLARCKACVSVGRTHQFPAFEEECCDNSVGAKLHKAIARVDVHAVSLLLSAGADPNYAQQASIDDIYPMQHSLSSRRHKLLWNQDGSIVHDIYNDGFQPTRPLPHVMFRLADCMILIYDHDNLNAIAKMLIDAGASLSPAVEILRCRNAYTYENFKITTWEDWPAAITLWRAQHGLRQVLEQCQKHDRFDFGEYFQ
jgi:hypothetical protein